MEEKLIVYFSHSENTKKLANDIRKMLDADIFEIKTVNSYPVDYNDVVNQARKELDSNFRPELIADINLDKYKTIFIGYPNWWNTMPMGVFTFLENHNLSGKTIIPFCTHEGSGLGRSVKDIENLCLDSKIIKGIAIKGGNVENSQNSLLTWLDELEVNSIL